MTLRDMINNGITLQGRVKLQRWECDSYPTVYYEGNIDEDPTSEFEEYLDREIDYVYPYVVNIGKVWIGAICVELAEEE